MSRSTFLSIPVAWFFIRVIFQVKYFAGINMMCIFIVCAIGADDIFVFMDAYVQSQFKVYMYIYVIH
jgi:hypothetical protein